MIDDLLAAKMEADKTNRPYAVLHVVGVKGSTPSVVGKAMVVMPENVVAAPGCESDTGCASDTGCESAAGDTRARLVGTIGGGKMEREAVADALEALKTGQPSYVRSYNGGGADEETLVCSPHTVEVFCEIFRHEMIAVICGNGHVGSKMAELCRFLDIYTILFDRQEAYAHSEFAGECHHVTDYRKGLCEAAIPEGAYYFIGTDSHESDKEALAGILTKKPKYIGMLGSRRKVTTVFEALKAEGMDPALFEPLHSPAGLHIANKKPEEVAFSILAEMLMIKNGGDGQPMRVEVR